MSLFIFALKLLLAIIIGEYAKHRKGRGKGRWFFFGFFLPLIAIVFVLLSKDIRKTDKS